MARALVSLVCAVLVGVVRCQDGVTTQAPIQGPTQAPTQANTTQEEQYEEFGLNMFHLASSTSSITIGWNVTFSQNISSTEHINHYLVYYRKDQLNFESDHLDRNSSEFVIPSLTHDTTYKICLVVSYQHHDVTENKTRCQSLYTIPMIHWLSLLVLCLVLAYVVGVFVLSYYCYKRNQKVAEDEKALTPEEEEKLNQEPEPQENGGTSAKPYSSIEQ